MRKNHWPLAFLCAAGALLTLLAACGGNNSYIFRVKVIDEAGQPVEQARVELTVSGNFTALSDVTVSNGYAILEIDASRQGRLARLEVAAPGYEPYSQYVNLLEGDLPAQIALRKNELSAAPTASVTALPTDVMPNTAVPSAAPPTLTPSVTPVTPAPTPLPTATNTLPPTPTPAPLARPVSRPLYVYAAPDINEPAVGTLALQATAVIVGRTTNAEWVEIATPQGKRGWVLPCSVVITGLPDWNVLPVTWQGSVIAYTCSDTIPPALAPSG